MKEWTKFREGDNYQTNSVKQSYNNLLTTHNFNILWMLKQYTVFPSDLAELVFHYSQPKQLNKIRRLNKQTHAVLDK
jgi:hypothetical protein